MFGFLKKAVGSLIDGVKKKLEGKPEGKPEGEPEEKPQEEIVEEVFDEEKKEELSLPDDEEEKRKEPAPSVEEESVSEKEPEEIPATEEEKEPILEEKIVPAEPKGEPVKEALPEQFQEKEIVEEISEDFLSPPKQLPETPKEPVPLAIEEGAEEPKIQEPAKELVEEPVPEKIVPSVIEKKELPPAQKSVKGAEKRPVQTIGQPKKAEKPAVQKKAPLPELPSKKKEEKTQAPSKKESEIPAFVPVPAPTKAEPVIEKASPVESGPEEPAGEEKKQGGFFGKLFGGLKKATEKVKKAVSEKTISEGDVSEILSKFELELIQANVASEVSEKICGKIREDLVGKKVARSQDVGELIVASLRKSVSEIVGKDSRGFFSIVESEKKRPLVLAFIGFNGSGKTTTIAKVANALKARGYSSVIAAGDTFRAAAVEQAEIHGERLGIKVVKQQYGADAAAVIFDSVKYAEAKGVDFVLADTAGRQHTNSNLMEELKKIVRVNKPDMKILVVDSLSGSDSVLQAKSFDDAVGGLSGVILTKVDVDEKGGTAISVAHTIGKPIFFLGMGQEYSDLKEFDTEEYLKMVFGD